MGLRVRTGLQAALLMCACQAYQPRDLDPARTAAAYEARSVDDPRVRSLRSALLGTHEAPAVWDAASLTVAALEFRAEIAVAALHVRRSDAAIVTAGARPNPVLALTPERVSGADAGQSAWAPTAVLDWRLETAGKRARRVDRARAEAESARFALRAQVAQMHVDIARALLAGELAAANVRSLQSQAAVAEELVDLWRRRIAAGAVSQVQAAPVRSQELDAVRALAEQRRAGVEAAVATAAAVGVPVAEIARVQARAPTPAELSPFAAIDRRAALERALGSRSDVRAALAEYAAAEAALALEIARQYPDVALGPGYQWDQGQGKWQVGLSLELPLLDQNEGPIAEAEALRAESEARFASIQARVIADVDAALARRDSSSVERNAAREIRAQRVEAVASAERALAEGAASRADVLSVRLDALRAEALEQQSDAAWRTALVDLAAALEALPFTPEDLEAWMHEHAAR